jgi:hypothetical protein
LLVGGKDGDRVALFGVHLIAHAVHVGAHSLPQLPPRERIAAISLTGRESRPNGIHGGAHRATARLGAAGDRRQPDDLLIRELKFTRVSEQQLRRRNASHRPISSIGLRLRREGRRGDHGQQCNDTNISHATLEEGV